MKKVVILIAVFAGLTLQVNATKHTVTISGFAYSPALLNANMGDTVIISASASHPLLQVGKATWNNDETTALAGGFGPTTKNFTFTLTSSDTIYYICTAHVTFGMKGKIVISQVSGINEIATVDVSVALYPNPVTATGTVKVSSYSNNPVTVSLFSINGQLEKDLSSRAILINGDSYYQFDATRLPSGNHFVMVTNGRNKVVKKFEVIR